MAIYVDKKKASKELIKSRLFIQKEIENLVDTARTLELCDTEKSVVSTLKTIKGIATNIVDEVAEMEQGEKCDT